MTKQPHIVRLTTVDLSLAKLLTGQMKFMNKKGMKITMMSAETIFRSDIISNEGCPHIVIPMKRQISLIHDIKCLFLLIKEFHVLKPDIVHTHTSKAGLLGMLAAKVSRVPVRIQTVAGTPPDAENSKFKKLIMFTSERITFWSATHVWPNSYSLLNYVKSNNFITPKKLEVIGRGSSNGIDLEKYSKSGLKEETVDLIKSKINYSKKMTYFLFVGRIVFDKGVVELIEACCSIANENHKISLLLVGELESHRSQVPDEIIEIIKNHPRIIYAGWSDEVEYYINLADYVIHPSHREGFPNIPLQAGALDTPLLVSDVVGNRDCIQHLETGYLFPAKSSKEIEKGMIFALNNKDLFEECARKWKTIIVENYERSSVQFNYYKRYCELLEIDHETKYPPNA